MKTKYVVLEDDSVIVFPEAINHSDFELVRVTDAFGHWDRKTAVSAGFIQFNTDSKGQVITHCYGRSVTLKMDSRGEVDSALADRQILGRYY